MGDTLSLVASFVKRPESYNKLCSSCCVYADFGADQTIPVNDLTVCAVATCER